MGKTMNSSDIKAAFAAAGLRARVRDFGMKFRVCFDHGHDVAVVNAVCLALGLTDVCGNVGRGNWNQSHEVFCYKPGAIVRV